MTNNYAIAIFIIGSVTIVTGVLTKNIIAVGIGGAICLLGIGVFVYSRCSNKESEARTPLLVDFVY